MGWVHDGSLQTREIYRFANAPTKQGHSLRWNLPDLVTNVKKGISHVDEPLTSVGIDTWAVDYGLLDSDGKLLDLPYHYRDSRTFGVMAKVFEIASKQEIYAQTGCQFLPFNTLYQLRAAVESGDEAFKSAAQIAMIPDLIHQSLTECKAPPIELTNASSTQCLNPVTRKWNANLLERLEIPLKLFPETIEPGTILGKLHGTQTNVVAPATHDTGSAVAGIPISGPETAWISSGTWSIVGLETPSPIISDLSFQFGLTNEIGFDCNRLSKNVMGLWIVQQLNVAWKSRFSYEELQNLAASQPSPKIFIDPDHEMFLAPNDMEAAIHFFCKLTHQAEPVGPAMIMRVVLESLALKYKFVLDQISLVAASRIHQLHIVGGGSKNSLLNQLTANACQLPVEAGPTESAAIGNLLVQMIATGAIESLQSGRQLVRSSFDVVRFEPNDDWLHSQLPYFTTLCHLN